MARLPEVVSYRQSNAFSANGLLAIRVSTRKSVVFRRVGGDWKEVGQTKVSAAARCIGWVYDTRLMTEDGEWVDVGLREAGTCRIPAVELNAYSMDVI